MWTRLIMKWARTNIIIIMRWGHLCLSMIRQSMAPQLRMTGQTSAVREQSTFSTLAKRGNANFPCTSKKGHENGYMKRYHQKQVCTSAYMCCVTFLWPLPMTFYICTGENHWTIFSRKTNVLSANHHRQNSLTRHKIHWITAVKIEMKSLSFFSI